MCNSPFFLLFFLFDVCCVAVVQHAQMSTHVHVGMHVGMCTWVCGPEADVGSLLWITVHLYFFETGSLTEPGAHQFGYTGCPMCIWDLPIAVPCPHQQCWGCRHAPFCLAFCMGSGIWSQVSHAHMVSTLLIKPSPMAGFTLHKSYFLELGGCDCATKSQIMRA